MGRSGRDCLEWLLIEHLADLSRHPLKRILIADREAAGRRRACQFLEKAGECVTADSSEGALESFMAHYNCGTPFHLVALDVELPSMGGLEALRSIRVWEEFHGIPLGHGAKVLMTAPRQDAVTVLTAFRWGCDGYLIKPFDQPELLATLSRIGFFECSSGPNSCCRKHVGAGGRAAVVDP